MTKDKFSQIYDTYSQEIYSFLFLRTQSQDTANDLVSEAFFKFWKSIKDKPEDYLKNPRAFLYRLSRNCLIDFYRKDSKENIISINENTNDDENEFAEIQLKSDDDIIKEFSKDEQKQMVLKSIRMLKPIYADVLIYYYIQGLDSKEISIIISKTEPNTRVIIHRALESLKKTIFK